MAEKTTAESCIFSVAKLFHEFLNGSCDAIPNAILLFSSMKMFISTSVLKNKDVSPFSFNNLEAKTVVCLPKRGYEYGRRIGNPPHHC